MSRNLTAPLLAALLGATVRPVLFYQGQFSTGTLRLTTAAQDVSWNGQTWTAAGGMLEISTVEEASDVRAVNFSVSLSGDFAAILAVALGAVRQGLPGAVWIGAFDSAGALIADPFKAFSGRLDVPDVLDDGTVCKIAVRYESCLIDLDRARLRRYTKDDQALDDPADLGFDYVPGLQDAQIKWGGQGSSGGGGFFPTLRGG